MNYPFNLLFELKQQNYFTVTLSVAFCCGLLHFAVVDIDNKNETDKPARRSQCSVLAANPKGNILDPH